MYCIILIDSTVIGCINDEVRDSITREFAQWYSSVIWLEYNRAIEFVDFIEE